MALAEVPAVLQRTCAVTPWPPHRTGSVAVAVVGEQDISNEVVLAADMARGIAASDDALVIDLQGVTFMGASTISVLVTTRRFLADRGRGLIVRSPSACARRLLDICGLADLIEDIPLESAASRS